MTQGRSTSSPVTIHTVAEHAGVSRQTVSNALNAPHKLLPETLERVTKSIAALGYRPNDAARSLKTQATRLIACRLLPSTTDGTVAVLDRFLHALCTSARDRGYDVLIFSAATDDDELSVMSDLLGRRAVDAYVLTETHAGDRRRSWLRERGAPFVSFGRPWGDEDGPDSWVDVDGALGVTRVVEHLIELGHRRIGFLGWPAGSGSGDDRLSGWTGALNRARLPRRGLLARTANGIDEARSAANSLLQQDDRPTALVCVSDTVAFGAMRAAADAGLRVGEDLSVVGFDDSPVAPLTQPALSSVRQPLEQVAERVVQLLLVEPPDRPVRELIEPTLVIRGSTAAARGPN